MIIEFHPEAPQQVIQLFLFKRSCLLFLFSYRVKMLVEPSRVERIPWIQLGYYTKVDEPVVLKHFMNGFRGMGRNLSAY